VRPEIWRYGRLWTALVLGVPAGLSFAVLEFAASGGAAQALLARLFFGGLWGGTMAMVVWRRWKGARDLDAADRLAVVRSVSRGEPIEDPRLAPAVVEYTGVVRRSHRQGPAKGTLWIWPALAVLVALAQTTTGSVGKAVLFWGLALAWIPLLWKLPSRETKAASRAAGAERAARKLMET